MDVPLSFPEHSFTAPIAAGTSNSGLDLLSLNVESRAKLMNFTISGASPKLHSRSYSTLL